VVFHAEGRKNVGAVSEAKFERIIGKMIE
jgi:hypothetical protein